VDVIVCAGIDGTDGVGIGDGVWIGCVEST
jgi:hypothetical protein